MTTEARLAAVEGDVGEIKHLLGVLVERLVILAPDQPLPDGIEHPADPTPAEILADLQARDPLAYLAVVEKRDPEAYLEWLAEVEPDEHLRLTNAQAWVEANDTRVRVVTSKAINLAQLDAELGGHGLCSDDADDIATPEVEVAIVACEGSPVTEAQLQAAIAAHVAVFPVPTPAEKLISTTGLTVDELKELVQ